MLKLINKTFSATKKGPGRVHLDGHQKASPVKASGAPFGFVLHEASFEKRLRRAEIKIAGRRQYLKKSKAARREPLPDGLVG